MITPLTTALNHATRLQASSSSSLLEGSGSGLYGEHGVAEFASEGGGGGRGGNRLRALRATRPHTVGYLERCDQEQGEIECPCSGFEVLGFWV